MIVLIILYLVGVILTFGAMQGTYYQVYEKYGHLPSISLYMMTQFITCICSFIGFFLLWAMISNEGIKLVFRYRSIYKV